jgi:hypothetical protein
MKQQVYYVRDMDKVVHCGKWKAFPFTLLCRGNRDNPEWNIDDEDAFEDTVATCLWCAVLAWAQ